MCCKTVRKHMRLQTVLIHAYKLYSTDGGLGCETTGNWWRDRPVWRWFRGLHAYNGAGRGILPHSNVRSKRNAFQKTPTFNLVVDIFIASPQWFDAYFACIRPLALQRQAEEVDDKGCFFLGQTGGPIANVRSDLGRLWQQWVFLKVLLPKSIFNEWMNLFHYTWTVNRLPCITQRKNVLSRVTAKPTNLHLQ